jgi:hypothetical protein
VEPKDCDLLYSPPDIMKDFDAFVTWACEWISARVLRTESPAGLYGLATNVILKSGVFPGVGRYTVEEIFLRAGL